MCASYSIHKRIKHKITKKDLDTMKKLIIIISAVLVVAVATLFTLGLTTKKDYTLTINNPNQIVVYKDGATRGFDDDAEPSVYETIMALYEESFKTTLFDAFRKGITSSKTELEYHSTSISLSAAGKTYLRFNYYDNQPLMIEGVQHVQWNTAQTYRSLAIELTGEEGIRAVNVFVLTQTENNYVFANFKYTVYMDTAELYRFVTGLDMPN